jgi:hypothetical protein
VALDDPVVFLHVFELVEHLHALGFLERKSDGAVVFVLANNVNVNTIAHFDGNVAGGVAEFCRGNLPFGLEIHVNKHIVIIHADDFALRDRAFLKIAEIGIEVVFKGAFEIDFVVVPGFQTCHMSSLQT